MRKLFSILLAVFCVLGVVGCTNQSQQVKGNRLLSEGNVIKIVVSSLPEEYSYSFEGEAVNEIVGYLSSLNLQSEFDENPDTYTGMTWVISLEYENGDTLSIYHFGNTFICSENGAWYKMDYDEASRFGALLDELKN